MKNTWRRSALAILSVPLLAAPSAWGVYLYLEPESGAYAAASAAIGFELLYLGVNVLILHTAELRAYGRRVALAAVATAVIFNSLAHYRMKVPGGLEGAPLDGLAFGLAILTSLPLAGLAYAVSVLLHRLSEHQPVPVPTPMPTLAMAYVASQPTPSAAGSITDRLEMLPTAEAFQAVPEASKAFFCPSCGTALTAGQYGAAKRYGKCGKCREVQG